MPWKAIFLSLALLAVAIVVGLILYSKYSVQGFQNPSPPSVPTFTMFYADWCGHCKKAKPAFVEFMSNGEVQIGEKKIKVAMINADSGDEKLNRMSVQGYPTFMLELPSGKVAEYKGKRDVPGYLAFLNNELGVKNTTA
jgi:protein disulfide-isomerase A6